jgi:hypothetical protein
VEDCLARWSIARARAVAWQDATLLWEARNHPHVVGHLTASLDAATAAAAQCLAMPLASHRRGPRTCRCGEQQPNLSPVGTGSVQ